MFNKLTKRYKSSAPQGTTLAEANRMLMITWEERNILWAGRDLLRAIVIAQFLIIVVLLFI